MLYAERSTVTIQLTEMTKSLSEYSRTVFLRNCAANLDGVLFQENLARGFRGALHAIASDIVIEATKFVENNASSRSVVYLYKSGGVFAKFFENSAEIGPSIYKGPPQPTT